MPAEPTNVLPPTAPGSASDLFAASRFRSRWWWFFFAAVITIATLLLHRRFISGDDDQPIIIAMLLPVLVSAYFGGLGPGLFATVLAVAGTLFMLLPPIFSFAIARPADTIRATLLFVIGVIVTLLADSLRRARAENRAQADALGVEPIQRKVRIALVAGCVLCAGVGITAVVSVTTFRRDVSWVEHTQVVINLLHDFATSFERAQSSARSYALSGDRVYKEDFDAAAHHAETLLGELQSKMADNPAQLTRVLELKEKLTLRLASARALVASPRDFAVPPDTAAALREGRRLHAEAAALLAQIENVERSLLSDREARSGNTAAVTNAVITSGVSLMLALVAIVFVLIDRDFAGSRRARTALASLNASLESRVAERTAELARTNAALRQTEAKFAQAFASNPAAIALTRLSDGLVLDVNDTWVRLCGYTREEIIGRSARMMWPSPEEAARFVEELRIRREIRDWEQPFRRKSGTMFISELWTKVLELDGETVILSTLVDITERKRVQESLRLSEERFREVVEAIDEVIWMADASDRHLLYVSPGYERIWGRSLESLHTSNPSWIETVHPDDRQRVLEAIATKQLRGSYDEVYRILRPNGDIRWVREHAYPIIDDAGVVSRIVGVAEDITEKEKLEQKFLRAQRLESVGMLAAGIAHDLNNVLAPIGMAAPLLRKSAERPSDQRLITILEQCADRGAGLVRQILSFVHGIGGEPRLVQVKHLMRDIAGVASETFPKSIELHDEVPRDLWPIMANPTQIHQVLLNLCVNARDAMPSGGKLTLRAENCVLDATAAATIPGAMAGNWTVLHIEDTGTGIPPDVLPRIWEPFFTTKASDKGTGLGLSTVRGIVEAHRGFITLATESGRGTTFRIYLPAAQSRDAAEHSEKNAPRTSGGGELILIVDDEETIRNLASATLMEAGYLVLEAANGAEAVTLFEQHASEIALVLTDLDMPVVNGSALGRYLHTRRPTTPIIVMSGTREDAGKHSVEEFVTDFLAKPFNAEALLHCVGQRLPAGRR